MDGPSGTNDDVEGVGDLDVEKTNEFGMTRLILACKNGSVATVRHLIQSGVKIDRNACGYTALDCCFVYSQLECMKLLMENGAKVDFLSYFMKRHLQNFYTWNQAPIEYLISLPSCPRATKIQALELLGSTCTDRETNRHLARGYWSRSLEERAKAEPRDLVQPKSQEPHPAYGNAREFQTVEELDRIASCEEDMSMQSLIIRERILGPTDLFTYTYIKDRAIAYLLAGNFDRCIELVTHIVIKPPEDLRFVNFFEILRVLPNLMRKRSEAKEDRLTVFIKSIDLMGVMLHPKRGSVVEYSDFYYFDFITVVVGFFNRLVKIPSTMSEEESQRFHQSVCKLMSMNPHGDLFHRLLRNYLLCPDLSPLYDFVEVLLKAGAIPQAVDCTGSTPLHLIAERDHPDRCRIIDMLLSTCCDCVFGIRNAKQKLFTDYLPSEMLVVIRKHFGFCQLQCLSAKATVKYKIPYESLLPNKLVKFVDLHLNC